MVYVVWIMGKLVYEGVFFCKIYFFEEDVCGCLEVGIKMEEEF